jgi:hypothetical protein
MALLLQKIFAKQFRQQTIVTVNGPLQPVPSNNYNNNQINKYNR